MGGETPFRVQRREHGLGGDARRAVQGDAAVIRVRYRANIL
jgi:hypothetical protein